MSTTREMSAAAWRHSIAVSNVSASRQLIVSNSFVRVFFALVPPPPLQNALGELARDVARSAHGRPVPARNIHLTLAFVGAWPLARMPALQAAGASLVSKTFRLALDVQGGFRRAGVAWIGASASPPALEQLARSLAVALAAEGVGLKEREFNPHLTLARKCRGPYRNDDPAGPFAWHVDQVTLMQSETRAEGARYRPLAQWRLSPAIPAKPIST